MFNKYKLPLILASVVTLLPIPVRLLLGRDGNAILAAPLLLLAAFWVCVWFTLKDNENNQQNPKALRIVFWIIPALSILTNIMDYAFTTGLDFDAERLLCLFLGVLFIVIGNYLPKVRRNSTLGIKLPWTFSSDENWNATHRLGGKVWFLCGVVVLIGSFLPEMWNFYCLILAVLVACVVPSVYSYLFYRKQKAAGADLDLKPMLPGRSAKTSLIFLAGVAVFVVCILFTGEINYVFEEDSFTVEASYFDDLTIQYDDIQDVKYLDENMAGRRVWGFGSLRLLMGTFETEGVRYTRYTYYDADSAVGLLVNGQMVILSGKNPEESMEVYKTLLAKCGTVG